MSPKHLACCLALGSAAIIAAPLVAAQNHTSPPQANPHHARHSASSQRQNDEQEGQRIFSQNCARCHNAPDGFAPRITGTIVRHMRVRASLSQHDEQVLLHYFIQ